MFIYFRGNSVFLYVVKSIFLCLIISFLFAVLIDVFIGIKGVDSPADNISLIDVLGGSIVSPLLETLLLMILVTFFKLFLKVIMLRQFLYHWFFPIFTICLYHIGVG